MSEPKETKLSDGRLVIPVTVDGAVYWVPSRALSLTQPWPYLMLHLPPQYRKDVENRVPNFKQINFRGPVWGHGASTSTQAAWDAAKSEFNRRYCDSAIAEDALPPEARMSWHVGRTGSQFFESGGIVGQFTITGYYPPGPPKARWHFANHHGFPVKNPTPVPFTECNGALGFWRVPYPILCSTVRAMLRAGQGVPDARNDSTTGTTSARATG